jgi:hypothetical protein
VGGSLLQAMQANAGKTIANAERHLRHDIYASRG